MSTSLKKQKMDSTVFKYKGHCQQRQHNQKHFSNTGNNNNHSNNQNSIFILNTTTNNILPNNSKLFYSDLNDNNVVTSSSCNNTTSSSVWSSASSTMCSPAAHAIQKLFNCSSSSSNSLKLNQGNHSGIESKSFKNKSELLKKKSKFWKYLEGEANDKNVQQGIKNVIKVEPEQTKSHKNKLKYWLKSSYESDNQNNQDLSELLEFSCSLCDNCQCMDCQISYFDYDNSDDNNSEYSFHLSAYEEDDEDINSESIGIIKSIDEVSVELNLSEEECSNKLTNFNDSDCHKMDNKPHDFLNLEPKTTSNCNMVQNCQQCLLHNDSEEHTNRDH